MNNIDRIKKRIHNLICLGNDRSATQNEAMQAIKKAHELLEKHNLSMEDIGQKNKNSVDRELLTQMHPYFFEPYQYLAKLFECEYVLLKEDYKKGFIIGFEYDRKLFINCFNIIEKCYECELSKVLDSELVDGFSINIVIDSFAMGFSLSISGKIQKLIKNNEFNLQMSQLLGIKTKQSNTLVLFKETEIKEFMEENFNSCNDIVKLEEPDIDYHSFIEGMKAGNIVEINSKGK